MASAIGLSYRREAAEKRLRDAFGRLADQFGLDFTDPPAKRRDADTEAVESMERWADRLDAIGEATTGEWVTASVETFTDDDGNPIPGVDLLQREIEQLRDQIARRDEQLRALGVKPETLDAPDGEPVSVEITDDGTPVVVTETVVADADWPKWYQGYRTKAEKAEETIPDLLADETQAAYDERTKPATEAT